LHGRRQVDVDALHVNLRREIFSVFLRVFPHGLDLDSAEASPCGAA
jgi:hypothetical protein